MLRIKGWKRGVVPALLVAALVAARAAAAQEPVMVVSAKSVDTRGRKWITDVTPKIAP